MDRYRGLPFEERCQLAIETLRGYQADLSNFQEENLGLLQDMKVRFGPKPEDSGLVRELKEELLKENALGAAYESMANSAWQAAIATTRALLGEDATEFALTVVKKGTAFN